MTSLRHLVQDLRRLDAILPARRMADLAALPPTLSVTFDDIPQSAAEAGADVLEALGHLGTFYVSAGLMGADSPHGPMAGPEALARLASSGHEIGCHTNSHLNARQTDAEGFARDLDQNRQTVLERFGVVMTSFAFPFGGVTAGAKRAAAARYTTCRTTMPRLNRGRTDLHLLSAAPLYHRPGVPEQAAALLEDCARNGGWLIVYTHDIRPCPSASGCTPGQLEDLLRLAGRLGVSVAPVGVVAQTAARSGGA